MEAEIRVRKIQGKSAWSYQNSEEARKEFFLKPSVVAWPCQHVDFVLPGSKIVRE